MFQRTSRMEDRILLHSDRIYFLICARCLLSCHWAPVGIPLFFTLSLQVLRHIGKTSLNPLFSRLSSPFSLSLFSPPQQEGAQTVISAVRVRGAEQPAEAHHRPLPSAPSQFPPVRNLPSACPSYAAESLPPPQPLGSEGKACSRLLLCAGHLEVLIPCL